MSQRLKKMRSVLAKQGLDALLVRTFEGDSNNVYYLSGFSGSAAVLVITKKKAFIVTDGRYYMRAQKEAPEFKLVKVKRGSRLTEHINEALTMAGLGKTSKVGFESDHLSVHFAKTWCKEIKAKLVPTVHLVERFRQCKDSCEIELLTLACKVTSRVFREVAPLIKAGMTEAEVAFAIDMRLRKHGASGNSFSTIVASGPNSAMPHYATGQRKLKAGEPVILDFGGVFPGGYCSDLTRTIFVPGKKPQAELVKIYKIVLSANKAARKALKPGITWKQYDKVARDYIEQHGYAKQFTHGLGHSLGLAAHDPYDYEHDPFQEGAVVTDEPGIYCEGLGGVRIEDDLVVTADGAERLTSAPYLRV